MKYHLFERVVLDRNLPEHRLRRGDRGTIVEIYEPDGIEVEFMDASGNTRAVVTLSMEDTHPAGDHDPAGGGRRVGTA